MGRKRQSEPRNDWGSDEREYMPLAKVGVESMNVKLLKPLTEFHVEVREKIKENIVTFLIGPAGTSKTYTAVSQALVALKEGTAKKIIITRPAITANENHGFLPGTLDDKMAPFILPIIDCIDETVGIEVRKKLLYEEIIEIAPIAFMRGRTFTDAFVVVDEVQNCTAEQLVMAVTRLGYRTKMVLTGDPNQSDLPREVANAFIKIWHLFGKEVPGVGYVQYDKSHIVRPKIVRDILTALEDRS